MIKDKVVVRPVSGVEWSGKGGYNIWKYEGSRAPVHCHRAMSHMAQCGSVVILIL